MLLPELPLTHVAQQLLRADSQILILADEQPQLIGKVMVGLVIGCSR